MFEIIDSPIEWSGFRTFGTPQTNCALRTALSANETVFPNKRTYEATLLCKKSLIMSGRLLIMSGFNLIMSELVLIMSGFNLIMSELVLIMSGFNLIMSEFVLIMSEH